jgi:hypothetical protein
VEGKRPIVLSLRLQTFQRLASLPDFKTAQGLNCRRHLSTNLCHLRNRAVSSCDGDGAAVASLRRGAYRGTCASQRGWDALGSPQGFVPDTRTPFRLGADDAVKGSLRLL